MRWEEGLSLLPGRGHGLYKSFSQPLQHIRGVFDPAPRANDRSLRPESVDTDSG